MGGGRAWGICRMALAYKYGKGRIHSSSGCHGLFLAHLPKDMVPFWDLEFTDGDDQPRDSSGVDRNMRNA
ncbi:hypothetical protein [Clostridium fessum]|uniref:hypothetical protein n=1 Tax=Clostridium fessum TaxID=2126740 RepID=UPI00399C227C